MPVRVPRALLVLAVGLTVGLVALMVVRSATGRSLGPAEPSGSAPAAARDAARTTAPVTSEAPAVEVLHAWDVRRAAAWAAGDPDALAALYTQGSTAGAADVALLRRYRSHGLVVRELRMQLLRVRVLTSRPRLAVLEVTDRLASAVAYERSEGARLLPRGAVTTHRLVLRRVDGLWRMAEVSGPPVER